jgi:NAD(P)-dependent dehydrogenase (short-subunit alcohol dehydrogenase family)
MLPLTGKHVVVIGGSRGIGRRVVESAIRNGARVLAVARQEIPLRQLAKEVPGSEILSLDATDDGAPGKSFRHPEAAYPGGGRGRVSAHRAAAQAELAGVQGQLEDGR